MQKIGTRRGAHTLVGGRRTSGAASCGSVDAGLAESRHGRLGAADLCRRLGWEDNYVRPVRETKRAGARMGWNERPQDQGDMAARCASQG